MLRSLLQELRAVLATVDEPMAETFVPILDRALEGPVAGVSTPFPLDDQPALGPLTNGRTAAATIATASADLAWHQPPADVVPPGWAHRAAACELIGPDGMVTGLGAERFGLFYLAADLHYPDHWHNAEEFYLVLAGSAEWTVDDVTTRRGPGEWSHTPVRAVHRIVTHEQPVLAMWGWSGDTSFDSYGY